jgi:hypothetical protein
MSQNSNGVAWPPTRRLTSSRFKSLELTQGPKREASEARKRVKESFGRLTVLTDHDTRASKIYCTWETDFQKHIYNIVYRYVTSMVDRRIDCTGHDFDDKICEEGRPCLTGGGRIHHVLLKYAISFIRVKTCCGY